MAIYEEVLAWSERLPPWRSDALRRQWGAGPDSLVMLVVGRLAAEKNLDVALQAHAAMQAHHADVKLVFVGDGPMRDALERRCPQARFMGSQTQAELARSYASADLLLFPSLTETFGNVTLEALASGIERRHEQLDAQLLASCSINLVANLTRGCRPFALIENVVTHSEHRGCGYGQALLAYAKAFAWDQGCYKVMLMTGRKDEATFQFYESAGFDRHAKQAFTAKANNSP